MRLASFLFPVNFIKWRAGWTIFLPFFPLFSKKFKKNQKNFKIFKTLNYKDYFEF